MDATTHPGGNGRLGWIGQPITPASVAAVMGIALVTSITMQVEPILLTGLAESGRIAVGQIGQVATAEFAATGVVTVITVAKLRYDKVRIATIVAALLAVLANIVTATVPSAMAVFGARLLSGCASGVFMWLLIGMFTRSTLPSRLNGIYLALQGGVALLMAAIFGTFVMPRFGADGAFLILAAISALATLAAFTLPRTFDPPVMAGGSSGNLPVRGWIALLSALLSMAGVLAMWVHVPPLAAQIGYPDWAAKIAVPLAIGMEVAGGLAAAVLATRGGWLLILQINFLALVAIAGILSLVQSPIAYIIAAGGLGFLWMFTSPFQYPLALAADPSRRTMTYLSPAQLIGAGVGPMIGSLGVVNGDVRGAMAIAAITMIIALVLMTAAVSRRAVAPDHQPAT